MSVTALDSASLPPPSEVKRPRRVIVAEDQPEMRALLCHALRRDGIEVHEAVSGTHLVDVLLAALTGGEIGWRPDLIISDVRMPGASGLEVLGRIRRFDDETPVVLITAFGDRQLHEEAQRLGATQVLDKPFELEDLRALVKSVLSL